jgi:hypothetical protein
MVWARWGSGVEGRYLLHYYNSNTGTVSWSKLFAGDQIVDSTFIHA